MGTTAHTWTDDELLGHVEWVRRLARTLVSDDASADDLAQTVWQRALERPPAATGSFRGWLATVMRNTLASERRGAARRAEREERVGREREAGVGGRRPGGAPTDVVVARAERQQELVSHVLALPLAQREAVLLRFFEGLAPREIADRLERPVNTVRTQLERGLATLKHKLEKEYGEHDWRAALAPLLGLDALVPAAQTAGGGLVFAKLAAAAVALVLGWIGWSSWRDAGERAPRDTGAVAPIVASRDSSSDDDAPARDEGRSAVETPAEPEAQPAEITPVAAPRKTRIVGRVLDIEGRPVPNLALQVFDPEDDRIERFWSDSQGNFEYQSPRMLARCAERDLVVVDRAYKHVEDFEGRLEMVVAPARELDVLVRTESGEPVADALVWWQVSVASLPSFPVAFEQSGAFDGQAQTDENGKVSFDKVAWLPQTVVLTSRRQRGPNPVVRLADVGLEVDTVELVVPDSDWRDWHRIAGQVVDADGKPVVGATVGLGSEVETMSRAGGAFELAVDEASSDLWNASALRPDASLPVLFAVVEGLQPAVDAELAADLQAHPGDRSGIVLRLGAPTLTIEGRVVDEHGDPRSGIELTLIDPSAVAPRRGFGADTLERRVMPEGSRTRSYGPHAVSDDDGRFVVAGLSSRDYRLGVLDPDTFQTAWTEPVPAGTRELELVLSSTELRPVVGRVVDRRGAPLADVAVALQRSFTPFEGSPHTQREFARTDDDGRFELEAVPDRDVRIAVGGEQLRSTAVDGPYPTPPQELVLVVERYCRVRIETAVADASSAGFLDADGELMQGYMYTATGRSIVRPFPLVGDRAFAVTDSAETVVLYRYDGEKNIEILRRPVQLDPETLTVIEL